MLWKTIFQDSSECANTKLIKLSVSSDDSQNYAIGELQIKITCKICLKFIYNCEILN